MNTGKIVMIRLGVCVIGITAVGAAADHPIPPNPPVAHTNQGRNVDDELPIRGSDPFSHPVIGDESTRGIWIPPDFNGNWDIDRLTLPEFLCLRRQAGASDVDV